MFCSYTHRKPKTSHTGSSKPERQTLPWRTFFTECNDHCNANAEVNKSAFENVYPRVWCKGYFIEMVTRGAQCLIPFTIL